MCGFSFVLKKNFVLGIGLQELWKMICNMCFFVSLSFFPSCRCIVELSDCIIALVLLMTE